MTLAAPRRRAALRWPDEAALGTEVWAAVPFRPEEWPGAFEPARHEHAGLLRALVASGARVVALVPSDSEREAACRRMGEAAEAVRWLRQPYGDAWLRDTMPLVLHDAAGTPAAAVTLRFDGWGGKYLIEGDADLAERAARLLELPRRALPLRGEGGSLETDGEGTLLASRTSLLARNPGLHHDALAERLLRALGAERLLWVDGQLRGDHTDGHVDTLARFAGPGRLLLAEPPPDGHDAAVLEGLWRRLDGVRDARGRALRLLAVPSPGRLTGPRGEVLPGSYLNFLLAGDAVLVPQYGAWADELALQALADAFPARRVLGVPARALLSGGGAVHCLTMGVGGAARPA